MRKLVLLLLALNLLPVPPLRAEEAPPKLISAVQTYVERKGYHELPSFQHALTDLNGDGRADAIVLLQGLTWCGSGGCTMLIFRGRKADFTFVSGSTITGTPIRISDDKTAGWKNLIVFSKGRGDVLMRFNGTRYPLNPSSQPKATPAKLRAAQIVMGSQ